MKAEIIIERKSFGGLERPNEPSVQRLLDHLTSRGLDLNDLLFSGHEYETDDIDYAKIDSQKISDESWSQSGSRNYANTGEIALASFDMANTSPDNLLYELAVERKKAELRGDMDEYRRIDKEMQNIKDNLESYRETFHTARLQVIEAPKVPVYYCTEYRGLFERDQESNPLSYASGGYMDDRGLLSYYSASKLRANGARVVDLADATDSDRIDDQMLVIADGSTLQKGLLGIIECNFAYIEVD